MSKIIICIDPSDGSVSSVDFSGLSDHEYYKEQRELNLLPPHIKSNMGFGLFSYFRVIPRSSLDDYCETYSNLYKIINTLDELDIRNLHEYISSIVEEDEKIPYP